MLDIPVIISFLTVVVGAVGVLVRRDIARRQELGLDQWLRDLRAWASEAIDVLSEVIYAWDEPKGMSASDRSRCVHRLSALIDRGRFFLPNVDKETDNEGKADDPKNKDKADPSPKAYEGLRHTALDPLVAAVNVIEQTHPKGRKVLWELRRDFVSLIFLILDPVQHNKRIAAHIRESDERVEALLPEIPPGEFEMLRRVEERIDKTT